MTDDISTGPPDDVVSVEAETDAQSRRDRNGVASLRDTQEESGDEEEVADAFDIDEREARELGVDLEGGTDDEPRLD